MKSSSYAILMAVSGAVHLSQPGLAQVILNPNTIAGTIRFTNANPAILDLLNPPGDEGMAYVYVGANSLPPAPFFSTGTDSVPADSRTSTTYELTVDSSETGIAYAVTPRLTMAEAQLYYLPTRESVPVLAGGPAIQMDFEDCVGVLTVRFRDTEGNPISVDGGDVRNDDYTIHRSTLPAGAGKLRVYLPGGTSQILNLSVYRGADYYTDRLTYFLRTNVTVACDELATLDMVIPDAGDLGQITGQVDMLGEFELTVDGRDDLNYVDSTGILAKNGPFGNQRWATVPGLGFLIPSSGGYLLPNVAPSTLDPASQGYMVHAQMYLRSHRRIQSFRSPALGGGANAALPIAPGEHVDLGNLFVIDPGYLRGQVLLQGPGETPDRSSLLRGLLHASDHDVDADGVPDALGTYGVYWSSVGAEGVDQPATGATRTAAYGYANADFPGDFNADTAAFEGDYELAVGGLNSEASLWRPKYLSLSLASSADAPVSQYFYNVFSIADHRAPALEIAPGQATTHDLAYCFSEVTLVFRSSGTPFFSPQVRFSQGSFQGTDFQGNPADYTVYVDADFGMPNTAGTAAHVGQVILALPQGTYRLYPFVTPADSSYALTGLPPIDLTVGCGQQILLEQCLQVDLPVPECLTPGPLPLTGTVRSCTNTVTRITYQLNGADPVLACEECGLSPEFLLDLVLEPGLNTLTVTAEDDQGGTSSLSTSLVTDTQPPVLQCPDDLLVEATRPCGAVVEFEIEAMDHCDPAPVIVCTPPSGSLFAPGQTVVHCTATDAAGNVSECFFTVTVSEETIFLPPTVTTVSPGVIAVSGGTAITVRGELLTVDDEVLLDGVPLSYLVPVSAEEIRGLAPALPPGQHTVEIRRCGEMVASLANACASGVLPRIVAFDPPQAFAAGGNWVTVHGRDFQPNTQVRIGFAAPHGTENLLLNTTVSPDGTTLIGQVPPLPLGEPLGPRDVLVQDERGQDLLPAGLTYLPNPTELDPQVISLRALEAASAEPLGVVFRNGFPIAMNLSVRVAGGDGPERARSFLRAYRELFRQADPDGDLLVRRASPAPLEHVALAQSYRGVPIFGAELVVSLLGDEVLAASGSLLPPALLEELDFRVRPELTPEQAEESARLVLALPGAPVLQAPELVIFDPCVLRTALPEPHLAWRISLQGAHHELFVDAHTGEVVFQLSHDQEGGPDLHGFDLDMQDAEDEANAADDWCFNLSNDTDVATEDWFNSDYNGDPDAVMGNLHARNTWAFYHRNFEWHSYDNDFGQLEVFIHATVGNAAWSDFCELAQFRTGWVDFEIMVHEMGHGIINETSELVYKFESGALNEHYVDMMAVVADREAGDLNWFLGENRTGMGGFVRDLQNPAVFKKSVYQNRAGDDDNGGVHANSGIGNLAGVLMVTGGMTNGVLVRNGMGLQKMRDLKWEAMRNLARSAGYDAARSFELGTAIAWARSGAHGFTQEDVCTVRNAWAAVEVGSPDFNCDGVEERLADLDKDYWPNQFDNCPTQANFDQRDADGDGRGDVCDNCPNQFNPGQEDLDGDNKGDVCDDDIDGDGCKNTVDQHPDTAQARVGSYLSATCQQKTGLVYGWEGGNHDGDVLLDCQDLDDDNDGVPDDLDPCPIHFGTDPVSCRGVRDCGLLQNDWWRTCLGGGCVQFYSRIVSVINPDPTQAVLVDQVQVVNQTLYLQPSAGTSLSGLAQRIAQVGQLRALGGGGALGGEPNLVRVELWARATETEPAHLVAIVGEYDPATLQVGPSDAGRLLALTLGSGDQPPTLEASWQPGEDPALAHQDSDGDGLPDGWEIQHGLDPNNPDDALLDSDSDGANNHQEYQAGTDPHDPTSVFRILRIDHADGQTRVVFVGTPARRFQLERSRVLGSEDWEPVAELPGRGGIESLVDGDPETVGQAFYRLSSLPD